MKYLTIDLGNLDSSTPVRVDITGTEANVQLLDATNYARYMRSEHFHYVGGHYKQSPAMLRTTHPAHWYVVADLGGGRGRLGITATVC